MGISFPGYPRSPQGADTFEFPGKSMGHSDVAPAGTSGLPTAPTLADSPSPRGSAARLPADSSGLSCFVFAFSMETSCGPKPGFSVTAKNKVLKIS